MALRFGRVFLERSFVYSFLSLDFSSLLSLQLMHSRSKIAGVPGQGIGSKVGALIFLTYGKVSPVLFFGLEADVLSCIHFEPPFNH